MKGKKEGTPETVQKGKRIFRTMADNRQGKRKKEEKKRSPLFPV